ncbi:LD-carboxypeptidase [Georgenia sp. TF02-10]|uniref:S66 family peptidase n=1 Tax=Georgenia sp. TF02-10 TaxID=2917725 RepID=UPI001FA7A458|nr:S66 peptidase family protein [Georgenia sp. TF02-10]UNX55993.1 LD-carboxypeptidase [Georgenia sp. TF02-10]
MLASAQSCCRTLGELVRQDEAMTLRYPAALRPGDCIGITSPSSGVPADLRPRLNFSVQHLRDRGFDVVVGGCIDGEGVVSALARDRGAELTAMLTDPGIRAVVPPWGGELAVEVLPHVDWAAVRAADPTWVVGYSDISTLLLPLTTLTGTATVHGQNLLETPYRVPEPLRSWIDVVSLPPGEGFAQGPSTYHRADGFDRWQDDPTVTEFTLDTPGTWKLLDPHEQLNVTGRLIGGCIETVSILAGTPYGDLPSFVEDYAPEGVILYLEASGDVATDVARHLWRMRLAGWFDHANAVLVGRTRAPDGYGFTQLDAVRSALDGVDVPVVVDVDCGHVPPHLALVNGALAELTVDGDEKILRQRLI